MSPVDVAWAEISHGYSNVQLAPAAGKLYGFEIGPGLHREKWLSLELSWAASMPTKIWPTKHSVDALLGPPKRT